jgi:hypothetical protein
VDARPPSLQAEHVTSFAVCLNAKDIPGGQVFQTSSFTLPRVVSGSNDIVLRWPDMTKNVM